MLLYLWTLTETVPVIVQVHDDYCTAVLAERSSQIPCPGIEGGEVGLYLAAASLDQKPWHKPIDLIAPGAAWQEIILTTAGDTGKEVKQDVVGNLDMGTSFYWSAPEDRSYTIQARLRRPDEQYAGILLLQQEGNDGWLLQVDSENRQAVWRHLVDGQSGAIIVGVPYQKPLVAQAQSLLRQIITTFFGAIGIILIVAIVQRVGRLAFSQFVPPSRSFAAMQLCKSKNFLPLILLLIILLSIFAVTLWIAVELLERLPHVQDSITYLFQAKTLARGALSAPEPLLSQAFFQEFLTISDGKWFGQYPPGYPALLAIGVLAGAVLTVIVSLNLFFLLAQSPGFFAWLQFHQRRREITGPGTSRGADIGFYSHR